MKRIKITNVFGSILLLVGLGWSQVPQTISYQGVLRHSDGTLVPVAGGDTTASILFTLYDVNNQAVWSEPHSGFTGNPVTVTDGVFSVILGKETLFSTINETPHWLGIKVGDDVEMTPRIELTSVIYALHAERSDTSNYAQEAEKVSGDGATDNYFFSTGNVGIGTTAPTAKLEVVGDVKADSLILTTPVERWYAIPGAEFDNNGSTKTMQPYYVYTYGAGNWYAPVHLPHGATITGFEITITDDDSVDAAIYLYEVTQGNQSAAQRASFATVGYPGTITLSYYGFSQLVVDNQNNTFTVQVYYDTPQNGFNLRIHNARIRYTITTPLP